MVSVYVGVGVGGRHICAARRILLDARVPNTSHMSYVRTYVWFLSQRCLLLTRSAVLTLGRGIVAAVLLRYRIESVGLRG